MKSAQNPPPGGTFGRYVAMSSDRGYLIYVSKGIVFGVPLDLDRFEVRGTPSPVLEEVGYSPVSGSAQVDASRGGTLMYRGGSAGGLITLQWLDGSGRTELFPAKPGAYGQPHMSPDGNQFAYADFPTGSQGDIWTVPVENDGAGLKTGKPEVFLQTSANELYPAFSPDGRWIAYRSNESGSDALQRILIDQVEPGEM